jgi:hypothetical protein
VVKYNIWKTYLLYTKKSNEKNGNGNIGFLCNYICNEINKKSLHAEHKLHIFTTNVIIILIGFKWICFHGNIYIYIYLNQQ